MVDTRQRSIEFREAPYPPLRPRRSTDELRLRLGCPAHERAERERSIAIHCDAELAQMNGRQDSFDRGRVKAGTLRHADGEDRRERGAIRVDGGFGRL